MPYFDSKKVGGIKDSLHSCYYAIMDCKEYDGSEVCVKLCKNEHGIISSLEVVLGPNCVHTITNTHLLISTEALAEKEMKYRCEFVFGDFISDCMKMSRKYPVQFNDATPDRIACNGTLIKKQTVQNDGKIIKIEFLRTMHELYPDKWAVQAKYPTRSNTRL